MAKTEYSVRPGNPEFPGVKVCDDGVNFATTVPDDLEAELVLTDRSGRELQRIALPVEERVGEVSAVFVSDMKKDSFEYYYLIDGKKVIDPYAGMLSREAARPVSPSYEWGASDLPMLQPEQLMLYKLHVRGFTKKAGSDVRHKGTFLGLTEKLSYIKELGFNAVELMPIYEWSSKLKVQPYTRLQPSQTDKKEKTAERRNYWGYAEQNYYFAPKQEFSSAEDSSVEVRDMIRAFHEAGIRIVMEMYFPDGTDPQLALSAVRYWKSVYHIDGFHLIGAGVPTELLCRDALLKRTMLFFEYIDERYCRANAKYRHLYEYNDTFKNVGRSLLKGDEGQTGKFVQLLRKNPENYGTVNYMANVNGFTLADTVSYDWKHNEENGEDNRDGTNYNCSWNCGVEGPSRKKQIRALRLKQLKNALLYVFLSQGVPLLYAGDERLNSQKGNNNAYASDDLTGWVEWNTGVDAEELYSFVKMLTAFRREHPVFHMKRELRGSDYRSTGIPDISFHDNRAWFCSFENVSRTLAVMYNGRYTQEENLPEDRIFYVAYNAGWNPNKFALPSLPKGLAWTRVLDSSDQKAADEAGQVLADQKYWQAVPRSVCVLTGTEYQAPKQETGSKLKKQDVKEA
ncbi:MAG: alpha-amylase family glycosyl hydrolase [Lachnospiraceae bacterium]|nr:alpha-amylase family glycosyl hydrolase [Lachnospiraceae bacterium]